MINLEYVKKHIFMAMLYCLLLFGLLGVIIFFDDIWLVVFHSFLFGASAATIIYRKKYNHG